MSEVIEQLKLENQICFPLYAVSRLVVQQYRPLLDELGITYPQYLVLLVLWENPEMPVKQISEKLFLESNTLTPLLKRMESNGFVKRSRSSTDERVVLVSLTKKGHQSRQKAVEIPEKLQQKLGCLPIEDEDMFTLKHILDKLLAAAKK